MERPGRITDTQTPRMMASMRFDCLNLLHQTLVLLATLLIGGGLTFEAIRCAHNARSVPLRRDGTFQSASCLARLASWKIRPSNT